MKSRLSFYITESITNRKIKQLIKIDYYYIHHKLKFYAWKNMFEKAKSPDYN